MLIGALQLDRRITDKMLKWVLVDIKRRREVNRSCYLLIRNAHVKVVSATDSSDVLLEHHVHSISKFLRCQRDRKCMFYLQRNSVDAPVVMFAFICEQEDKVRTELVVPDVYKHYVVTLKLIFVYKSQELSSLMVMMDKYLN